MTRTAFSRRRFLQLSGGLALAGVSLPLWAHDMAEMASGDAHPALRLPQPYKIKLAINKSAVCLAPVAVAEQQKIFSKYNLDVELLTSATPPMCCWRRSPPARPTPVWEWRFAG